MNHGKEHVAMGNKPHHFVLRCYGYKDKRGKWYGVCLELNLAAEANSVDELRKKLNEMIGSYIDTVLDTGDKASIPDLFRRRAPLMDWLYYGIIRLNQYIRQIPDKMTFDEIIPFNLAHGC